MAGMTIKKDLNLIQVLKIEFLEEIPARWRE